MRQPGRQGRREKAWAAPPRRGPRHHSFFRLGLGHGTAHRTRRAGPPGRGPGAARPPPGVPGPDGRGGESPHRASFPRRRWGGRAPPAPTGCGQPYLHPGASARAPLHSWSWRRRPTTGPCRAPDLIGREEPIDEITRLLATTRLLTPTEVGGGKTRLALRARMQALPAYSDGARAGRVGHADRPGAGGPRVSPARGVGTRRARHLPEPNASTPWPSRLRRPGDTSARALAPGRRGRLRASTARRAPAGTRRAPDIGRPAPAGLPPSPGPRTAIIDGWSIRVSAVQEGVP